MSPFNQLLAYCVTLEFVDERCSVWAVEINSDGVPTDSNVISILIDNINKVYAFMSIDCHELPRGNKYTCSCSARAVYCV